MKKGLIIFAAVAGSLLLVGAGAVAAFYSWADGAYGIAQAPEVSHTEIEPDLTRLRVVARPGLARDFILSNLPEAQLQQLPAMVRDNMETIINSGLPYEVALLGGADYVANAFAFTVFINEQRGGPVLVESLNDSNFFANPAIDWVDGAFTMPERGIVTTRGQLALPQGMESLVLQTYPADPPVAPMAIAGGHLIEAVLDNRNGDALALIGIVARQNSGLPIAELVEQPPLNQFVPVLAQFLSAHIHADLVDNDSMSIQLFMDGKEGTAGEGSQPFVGIGNFVLLRELRNQLTRQGLTLEGRLEHDGPDVTGDFTLSGLQTVLARMTGENPPAMPPVPAG